MLCVNKDLSVHGDIRHLEIVAISFDSWSSVHGDIRHLENVCEWSRDSKHVHGDIRHLEMKRMSFLNG